MLGAHLWLILKKNVRSNSMLLCLLNISNYPKNFQWIFFVKKSFFLCHRYKKARVGYEITEGWAQASGPSLVQWRALSPWSSGITYKNRKKEIPT